MHKALRCGLWAVLAAAAASSRGAEPTDAASYLSIRASRVALRHVEVIDGTGAAPRADQTLVIVDGRIAAVGPDAATPIPPDAEVRDYAGYAVLPGLVGMHDHLFYTASRDTQRNSPGGLEPGFVVNEIPFTAPRLYLAAGVTTLRTTGSIEPYADLKVRSRIEAGALPGPHLDLTAPYLEGAGTYFAQMHELGGPEEAGRFVDYWAATGMTSFKAYMNITRAELAAAAAAAHRHRLKITAHLCSVSWPEAIAAGIDDLEHGPVYTDSEFVANRQPDHCPEPSAMSNSWLARQVGDADVQGLIRSLVAHHVAVTSTLPVFELIVPGRAPAQRRALDAMSSAARDSYLTFRGLIDPANPAPAQLLRREMDFERSFAAAGGLLLAGPDPTGAGGVLPGFGDQREIELLVEAGFTALEAIRIGTQNGARFLGRERDIGTIAPGKHADLIVVHGDPAAHIEDLENVAMVFKDGQGYDPARLIAAVRGQVGIR
ncbi:MAG TPA: amidohydrolase family protein [Steroidobacteraceae bacterium]|nr:amidohydrolase family protein [Steroidobacteraceae bacterium]